MFRRMAQNPRRYMPEVKNCQDGLNGMITQCVSDLRSAELLNYVKKDMIELNVTKFGDVIVDKY